MVASISSTMLALRILEQRGMIDSIAGRIGVTFALTQDLAVVVLLAIVPLLGESDQNVGVAILLALGKAAAFLLGTAILGPLLVPRLLSLVARSHSRELFILAIVALALGTASISELAGLSLAFGAFLAGLVISESEYAHQTLANVMPLREIFAVVFFVAVGMLIDPGAALDAPEIVAATLIAGVLFKALVIAGPVRSFGYPATAATTAALALANTGEFSFIITEAAAEEGIADEELVASLLAAVFISLALGAPLAGLDARLAPLASVLPTISGFVAARPAVLEQSPAWVNHAVIGGYEEGAQELMSVLRGRDFKFIVIEEDPVIVRRLRDSGVVCILGDPALRTVLEQASIDRARVLAVTLSNANQAEDVVRQAREINPRLDVIARGAGPESHSRLQDLGAAIVVQPGLEVGLEFARHSLHRFGVTSQEIQSILAGRRRRYLS
jgi:CPA2 family monovalent cation:H+ antiporter-2